MNGPLILSIVGASLTALAALVGWLGVKPERARYNVGGSRHGVSTNTAFNEPVVYIPPDEGLRRMVRDQGLLTMVVFFGACLQLVAIVWRG